MQPTSTCRGAFRGELNHIGFRIVEEIKPNYTPEEFSRVARLGAGQVPAQRLESPPARL